MKTSYLIFVYLQFLLFDLDLVQGTEENERRFETDSVFFKFKSRKASGLVDSAVSGLGNLRQLEQRFRKRSNGCRHCVKWLRKYKSARKACRVSTGGSGLKLGLGDPKWVVCQRNLRASGPEKAVAFCKKWLHLLRKQRFGVEA